MKKKEVIDEVLRFRKLSKINESQSSDLEVLEDIKRFFEIASEEIRKQEIVQKLKTFFEKVSKEVSQETEDVESGVTFTPENMAKEVKNVGIYHPEVAIAQSILETGWFDSQIFKENNNLFGMKLPRIRPTVAAGENRGHASYSNWKESVKDYKLWQEFNDKSNQRKGNEPFSSMTAEEYLDYLDPIYCPPPDCPKGTYKEKVSQLLDDARKYMS